MPIIDITGLAGLLFLWTWMGPYIFPGLLPFGMTFSTVSLPYESLPHETVKKLIPKGSSPKKMYGRTQVHKNNNPARPVVSMIGTPEYQLAKFLDSIIKNEKFVSLFQDLRFFEVGLNREMSCCGVVRQLQQEVGPFLK